MEKLEEETLKSRRIKTDSKLNGSINKSENFTLNQAARHFSDAVLLFCEPNKNIKIGSNCKTNIQLPNTS